MKLKKKCIRSPRLNLGKIYLDKKNIIRLLIVSYVLMYASWKSRSLCIVYVIKIYIYYIQVKKIIVVHFSSETMSMACIRHSDINSIPSRLREKRQSVKNKI